MLNRKDITDQELESLIIDDIIFNRFKSGKINTAKLAKEKGVGVAICREALSRLAGRKVISFNTNIGYRKKKKISLEKVVATHDFYLSICTHLSDTIMFNINYEWVGKLNYYLSIWESLCRDYDVLVKEHSTKLKDDKLIREKKYILRQLMINNRNFFLYLFDNSRFAIKKMVHNFDFIMISPVTKFDESFYIWYKEHIPYLKDMISSLTSNDLKLFNKSFRSSLEHRASRYK